MGAVGSMEIKILDFHLSDFGTKRGKKSILEENFQFSWGGSRRSFWRELYILIFPLWEGGFFGERNKKKMGRNPRDFFLFSGALV